MDNNNNNNNNIDNFISVMKNGEPFPEHPKTIELRTENENLIRELEATKYLLSIAEEVAKARQYETDCAMGFAIQRDKLRTEITEMSAVISKCRDYMGDTMFSAITGYNHTVDSID